jgi:ABC-2 type transport system ATP-binding protein
MLKVAGLTKRYGALTALDAVSFSIRDGEVLGLIGPNGAGKTTLFECLAGLLPADRGSVTIDGRTIGVAQRGHHLFYVPDAIAPWPQQTVHWSLGFMLQYFGGAAERLGDVIDRFDLRSLLNARIGALSKGQRKRAMLALGLLTPQPLLLIDEPFDGLDLRQGRDVAASLRAHAAAGRTLFLSIHQIHDAARVCDRFVLLSGGQVRGEGTIDELAATAAANGTQPADPAKLEEVFLALT